MDRPAIPNASIPFDCFCVFDKDQKVKRLIKFDNSLTSEAGDYYVKRGNVNKWVARKGKPKAGEWVMAKFSLVPENVELDGNQLVSVLYTVFEMAHTHYLTPDEIDTTSIGNYRVMDKVK